MESYENEILARLDEVSMRPEDSGVSLDALEGAKVGDLESEALEILDKVSEEDKPRGSTLDKVRNDLLKIADDATDKADREARILLLKKDHNLTFRDNFDYSGTDFGSSTERLKIGNAVRAIEDNDERKVVGWGSLDEAKRFLEEDLNVSFEEDVVEEEEESENNLPEFIANNERKCMEIVMRNFDQTDFNNNFSFISDMLKASGLEDLVSEYQNGDPSNANSIQDEDLFLRARDLYMNEVVERRNIDQIERLALERDLVVYAKGDPKEKTKQLDKKILTLSMDLFNKRNWTNDEYALFVKQLRSIYGIAYSGEISASELDRVRGEIYKKFEQKLQFESNAKFDAPSLADMEAIYERYNLDETTRDELKSLAGLMLLSRTNLYMKQDPKVWSGASPDTYVDGKWINYAKKGLDDFVIRGFLSTKETSNFNFGKVNKAMQYFLTRGSSNIQGTTGIEIDLYCKETSVDLGITEYEARVAWMLYEQLYEPEYNSKNHLYSLTHTREAVDKVRSIWWGSPWMFTKAVTRGVFNNDPINDTSPVGENGMPTRMWQAVGERLDYIDEASRVQSLRDFVSRGNAFDFFKEFYSQENISTNQEVMAKLHNSANIMFGHFKKITEVGTKPETSSPKFLVELKNSIVDDLSTSDPRKDRSPSYASKKYRNIEENDCDTILDTVSKISFLQTSILHPGIDDKTLIDPVAAVKNYLYLVSSWDGKTNFFSREGVRNIASAKPQTERLRNFAFQIARIYTQSKTLMSQIDEKKVETIKAFTKDISGWFVPDKPVQYRDLWEKFRNKYGFKLNIFSRAGAAWNENVMGSLEEGMEDWIANNLGPLGKIITGRK